MRNDIKTKLLEIILLVSLSCCFLAGDAFCEKDDLDDKLAVTDRSMITSGDYAGSKDAERFLKEGRYKEAEAVCKKRITLNPSDYVAMSDLGNIYWLMDKRGAATRLFKKVVKHAPNYPIAHFLLGRSYFFANKHKDGLREFDIFKEKMGLLPKMDDNTVDYYVSILQAMGSMYHSLKRYDLIERECNRIIELRPDNQLAHYNLAVCYYQHYRNCARAYKELKKVIDIDYATKIADSAKFFIDYMRRNPDPDYKADFSFMEEY